MNRKENILIISGLSSQEHDFRKTNQMLVQLMESTGRFHVKVLEESRGISEELLMWYDAVLINYEGRTNFFNTPESFGNTTNQNLINFVYQMGKGIIFFHASCIQEDEWGWPREFNLMRGAEMNRNYCTRRNPKNDFVVKNMDNDHPILKGLSKEWFLVGDDFLAGVYLYPQAKTKVLAAIYDNIEAYQIPGWPPKHVPVNIPEGNLENMYGINSDQPIAWTNEYGNGRCFTITIGHDIDTFRRMDFIVMFCRGIEWVATGQVTLEPPDRKGKNRLTQWPYYSG